jgi:hypothetical protein
MSGSQAIEASLTNTVRMIGSKMNVADLVWKSVVSLATDLANQLAGAVTDLANAANSYITSQTGMGGSAMPPIVRIFQPARVFEYGACACKACEIRLASAYLVLTHAVVRPGAPGCYNQVFSGGECTARLATGQCYAWAPYTLQCGQTQRCIANCR